MFVWCRVVVKWNIKFGLMTKESPMPSSACSSGGECTVNSFVGECLPLLCVFQRTSVKGHIDLSSDQCNCVQMGDQMMWTKAAESQCRRLHLLKLPL